MGDKDNIIYLLKMSPLLPGLVVGILALNILFYFVWLRPVTIQRDEQQRMYGEIRKVMASGKTLKEKYLQAREDIDTFKAYLLEKEDQAKIIEEVTALIQQENLTLKDAHYSQKYVKAEGLWAYDMEFPLVGRYQAIKSFLNRLEGSPLVLCIERLKMARGKDGLLELSLTITSYFR